MRDPAPYRVSFPTDAVRVLLLNCFLGLALGACSGSDGPSPLTQVPLPPWDGGADAGCAIASTAIPIECATALRITGDPYACAGFDDAGSGAISTCEGLCDGRICGLSGLSDGSSAVVCGAKCSAVGEH